MASTIIARGAGVTAAHAAVAAIAAGTVVRYTYTFGFGRKEYTATGRVVSGEGESLHVIVLTHEEMPYLVGSGMLWSGRFSTVVRRPRRK